MQDEINKGAAPDDVMTGYDLGRIGRAEIKTAEDTLKKYKDGKAMLDKRIVDNERWYKLRQWEQIGKSSNPGDPEPASAWLFNVIINKHADAMDNYPKPLVLPREQADEADAKMLSDIIPVVLEQNDYKQVYSDATWYKLKSGTGVTGVFWDSKKLNGLGDISIRKIDLLNLFWEPGITDIQASRNLFHCELVHKDGLKQQYPQLKDALTNPTLEITQYIYDENVDTTDKTIVVDWYYKVWQGGRTVLHFCKFCAGEVLYASENDPAYAERGYYDHGLYPFVPDALYPVEGSIAGMSYIDIGKSPQLYIDKLDQVILKHSVMGARPRFFVRGDGKINEDEYADWNKDFVHYMGSGDPKDSILPIEVPSLSDIYVNVKQLKIDELKETSGNRDFSQGGTSGGVTAASAIASLQEAGNKLSRDMISSSYVAFSKVCTFVLELIRQFYTEDRCFRIVGDRGKAQYVYYNSANIQNKAMASMGGQVYRMPVFDIKVSAEKNSPYSTVVQNERAKELYGLGFFRPDLADQALAALEMMQFDGIDKVKDRIRQNNTMYQQIQQMQMQMMQMAAIIDSTQGTTITKGMAGAFGGAQMPRQGVQMPDRKPAGQNTIADKAMQRTAQGSSPNN